MTLKSAAVVTAFLSIFLGIAYQYALRDLIFITLGFGRVHQSIDEFPYSCRRIHHKLLEACEDLWLDEEGRTLYAACSDPFSRKGWSPGGDHYNLSARTLTDHVSILSIDEPGSDGFYGLRTLTDVGDYESASGGKELDLHGFVAEEVSKDLLRFWMINHRPAVHPTTGEALNAKKVGANSTIEVFDLERGSADWKHVRTIAKKAIDTPNNIATTGDGGFVITNDHDTKTGSFRILDMIFGGGGVAYCGPKDNCHKAATEGIRMANGIVRGHDGLFYVASSASGRISVHAFDEHRNLSKVDEIDIGIPMDNLSIDSNGDIFAACFPAPIALMKSLDAPYSTDVPSTVVRVRKLASGEYEQTRVLDDKEGKVLPGTTTAVHDVRTGRFFLSGIIAPYITVCEPNDSAK